MALFRRKKKPDPRYEHREGWNGSTLVCPVCGDSFWSFYGPLDPDPKPHREHSAYWYSQYAARAVCDRCVGSPEVLASEPR